MVFLPGDSQMPSTILSHLARLALGAAVLPSALTAADATANNYWLRLSGGAWLAPLDGSFAYGTGGDDGTKVGLDEVGLDERETNLFVEANVQLPFFLDVHAGYWALGTSGSGTLSQNIEFGDQVFLATDTIDSTLDITDLWAELAFGINTDLVGASIGVAVHLLAIDSTFTSRSSGESETFDEAFPIPMLAVRAHVHPFAALGLECVGHGISLDLDEGEVTVLDLRAQIVWRPWDRLGIFVGYRHFVVDILVEADDDSGVLDTTLSGPYAGLLAQF